MRKEFLKNTKRCVVKIGSSILGHSTREHKGKIKSIVEDLVPVIKQENKRQWAIVSSGAIAIGMTLMGRKKRPNHLPTLQALAAIGQPMLMNEFQECFSKYGIKCAQILVTWEDFSSRKRFENTRKTLEALTKSGVVPIINENDSVSTQEIEFGDNDQLSAMVGAMFNADLLLMLTGANGFYADYSKGEDTRLSMVDDLHASLFGSVKEVRSHRTKGGMRAKLKAIEKSLNAGIPCLLADGNDASIFSDLFKGDDKGTLFLPKVKKLKSKKHWIRYISRAEGALVLDEGAIIAIRTKGKSLLSKGIVKVRGAFEAGAALELSTQKGKVFGKGICNFSSEELTKILDLSTDKWEEALGRACMDEVIHRDNFVSQEK